MKHKRQYSAPIQPRGVGNTQMWRLSADPSWIIMEQIPESGNSLRYFAANEIGGSASPFFPTWKQADEWITKQREQ